MAKFKAGDRITHVNGRGRTYLVCIGERERFTLADPETGTFFGLDPNKDPDDYKLVEQPAARVVDTEQPPREGDTVLIRATYVKKDPRGDIVTVTANISLHGIIVQPETLVGVEKRRGLSDLEPD